MNLTVFDLDGSLPDQAPLAQALGQGARRLDLRDLGPLLRLWCREADYRQYRDRLRRLPDAAADGPAIVFIGSGDYHHLTPALLEGAGGRPVSLIHFDNHPDWVRFAPRRHCGSWVNRALQLPQVRRIVTIGPCSGDLASPQFKGGNLRALRDGRLQLYPWRHPPSRVWGRIGDGAGHRQDGGRLVWRNLADEPWDDFLREMLAGLPTDAVWITIDKDVLRAQDAATNWDQGEMSLSHLLRALRRIAAARRVIGIDVCGDFAPPSFPNILKRWETRTDQPARDRWSSGDLARNETTNAALIGLFREMFD